MKYPTTGMLIAAAIIAACYEPAVAGDNSIGFGVISDRDPGNFGDPKNIKYRKELNRVENLSAAEIAGYRATRAGEKAFDAAVMSWNVFAVAWNIATFPCFHYRAVRALQNCSRTRICTCRAVSFSGVTAGNPEAAPCRPYVESPKVGSLNRLSGLPGFA